MDSSVASVHIAEVALLLVVLFIRTAVLAYVADFQHGKAARRLITRLSYAHVQSLTECWTSVRVKYAFPSVGYD